MSWKVDVDAGTCIGSGMCAGTMPDAFRLDGEVAEPVQREMAPDEELLDVADSCPALAITVVDESGTEVGPRP
ncbi:cytochrome [Amycolatopsis antarctica]|uniref:Ferredoxin n=1 Tax=Amycolatopsis antarctica TaxID=1854586 RepID=A0A263DA76_9PSEU|nr:ferredoxin [Amycolatopsis antarctica]OZM75261.1 cytochrome [Amycolatopsis antarctica]